MRTLFFVLCLFSFPAVCFSTTSSDLQTRIRIDGRAIEYAADEWVLDTETPFRERSNDSRWGADNDIRRLAVTWDRSFLYIAVECKTYDSSLMLFVENTSGGARDLLSAGPLRRGIVFTGLSPNLIVVARSAVSEAAVTVVSPEEPFTPLDDERVESRMFQATETGGALEIALPWDVVRPEGGSLRLLSILTGGEGSGAGDAAPDPSSDLREDGAARVTLDNAVEITVDGDLDGEPDVGVSPRDLASYGLEQRAPVAEGQTFDIRLEAATFVPDQAQPLKFRIERAVSADPVQLYLTAEVYAADGRRVAVLFQNETRTFERSTIQPWDEWDGRGANGEIVPGGIYVLVVSGGVSRGAATHFARKPVAVAR